MKDPKTYTRAQACRLIAETDDVEKIEIDPGKDIKEKVWNSVLYSVCRRPFIVGLSIRECVENSIRLSFKLSVKTPVLGCVLFYARSKLRNKDK